MKKIEEYKRWIVLATFCLALVVLFIGIGQGKDQDQRYLNSYLLYQKALNHFDQEEYDEAHDIYETLLSSSRYHDSVSLNWEMGRTELSRENYAEALVYYDKVKEEYPAIVLEEDFLSEYSGLLRYLKDERFAYYEDKI